MNHQKVGWRLAVVAVVFLFGVIWTVPNFIDTTKTWWPTNNKMVMGLDIQGGLHLVMRVDVAGALKQEATRIAGTLRD
jgi:preprotein translocase subunit SecD